MSRKSKKRRQGKGPAAVAVEAIPRPALLSPPGDETAANMQPAWSGTDWIIALLLFGVLLLAYYPALHGTPLWDDDGHLTRPDLRSWTGLGRIWIDLRATQQYYPATHSAFWLQYRIWGDWYPGYHLVNVFLHALSALLLARILRLLAIPGAWLAAALWALHPVQVESVAWMSELKNTLSGVCYFGAALLYLRFHRQRSAKLYFAALGLYLFGLLAKSVVDTLPAALLLLFYWKYGNLRWRRDVRPLIPFFLTGIACGLLTAWLERAVGGASGSEYHFSLLDRGLIAGRALWFYLAKLLWPANLIFSYPRWQISAAILGQYVYPTLALGLAALLIWMRQRWGRGPLVALLYFAGTLFPALGFINIIPFRYSFVADHFQYLACAGPIVLFSAGMERMRGIFVKQHPLAVPSLCTTLLALLCILTWRQSRDYRDIETLWRATIAANPQSWLAHTNLGVILLQQGRVQQAISEDRQALQIDPSDADAHNNLGTALLKEGQIEGAVAEFDEALRLDPANADAHNNIGNLLLRQGRAQEAIAQYQVALRTNPSLADACYNLGTALLQLGRLGQAAAEFRETLRINPDYADASYNLANTLAQQGRIQEAISLYRDALRIDPSNAGAHNNLGLTLVRSGQFDQAIAEFAKAVQIQPADAEAHYNLGLVLLQHGQAAAAIAQFTEDLRLNPADAAAREDLAGALLKQGQPAQALDQLQKAYQLQPENLSIENSLAWLLATAPQPSLRDAARAVQLASHASQSAGGNNPAIFRTLAAAYAQAGQPANAVAAAQKALDLAQAAGDADLASSLRREIQLYRAGQPYQLH